MDTNILKNIKQEGHLTKESNNKNIRKILSGSMIAIILTLIFLTLYAVILSWTNISETTIVRVVLTITGISILIGSSISINNIKKQGMINGGMVGAIYILFIYIMSSIVTGKLNIDVNSIIMILVAIITGMVGGIIGVNLK